MSALEELQELYNADPDTERISLRGKQLDHVDAEMEYLQLHFAHIRHLDLSENALEALPIDFGQLLPKLVALDITRNKFRSVADLGDVLQKCASLKSLSVTLKSATEEKLLLVMLPKLRILNGTPLSSPASPPPPTLADSPVKAVHALSTVLLSPSTASNSSAGDGDNDNESHLSPGPVAPRSPTIASPQDKRTLRLQFANLKIERQAVDQERQRSAVSHANEALALTRKRRPTTAGTSSSVRAKSSSVRPTEKPATISDDRTDWHKLLKSQQSTRGDHVETEGVPPVTHEPEQLRGMVKPSVDGTESFLSQLKTVVKTFHQCNAKASNSGSSASASNQLMIYEQLDRHVDLLASQLSRQEREQLGSATQGHTRGSDDVVRMKSSLAMLQTRWNLLEVCGLYGVEKANGVDGTLGKAFEQLLLMQKEVLVALQHQQVAIAAKAHSVASIKSQEPNGNKPQEHEQQMRVLLEVAESLESDLEAAQARLQQEKAQRELVEQENWSLKRENEAFKRKPRSKDSNTSYGSVVTPQAIIANISERESATSTIAAAARPRIRKRSAEPKVGGSYAATMQNSPLVSQRSPQKKQSASGDQRAPKVLQAPATPPVTKEEPHLHHQPAVPTTATVPTARIRNLTLKQLVDLIQCITASKLKYDARAFEVGAPRETMEQHLYTYLNQRFGLKPLIVDYASAIWKGCEAFASQENDAATFLALLKNHVDEGFLSIKKKLKQALVDLLRTYFQAKFPLKQELAIAALVQNRTQHLIFEDEWQEMLTYLYDPQDVRVNGHQLRLELLRYDDFV